MTRIRHGATTGCLVRLGMAAALMVGSSLATPGMAAAASPAPTARVVGAPQFVDGARFVPQLDRFGGPSLQSGSAPFVRLVQPIAAARRDSELYVADIGRGSVMRIDSSMGLMAPVPNTPVSPGIRLAVGVDRSLYVLDMARRRVLRFAREGSLVASYAEERNLVRPVAFIVDDARGEVLVADGQLLHLVPFHPLGGAGQPIVPRGDERNTVRSIAGMAVGPDGLHLSDPACACIVVMRRDGTIQSSYGHREIALPGPIAIDRHGRSFVVDGFDRSVKVFAEGRRIAILPGGGDVVDLSLADSRLIVVNATSARVAVMPINGPGARP